MKQNAERSILTAAKLIAPVIDDSFAAGNVALIVILASYFYLTFYILYLSKCCLFSEQFTFSGYNWCLETLKTSNYAFLAAELEINKAVMYLKQKEITQAIETLKTFEKKTESKVVSSAATNLAFIYYLV